MGAIVDRLVIDDAVRDAELKPFLGIDAADTSHDVLLDLFIVAAKEAADEFCNNLFEDAEGVELDIPSAVKVGVFQLIAHLFNTRTPGRIVTREKAGDLEVAYAKTSATTAIDTQPECSTLLVKYRFIPGV